ncbi:MAG TPA: protein-methionine-sulfoxide reductase heme-binding subunit MsrQ [Burkholderiales bacterium]|nr:protein-methionine-sulfoxide reductase heme-binding subunit MsrQ [Burkholderiales bacterium]
MSPRRVSALKVFIFISALGPLAYLCFGLFFKPEWLGANPAEYITRMTGDWTLRFLLITLSVTPLRKMFDVNWLLRLRRMLGLFAFAYACFHFLSYIAFDHVFDVGEILLDIAKRPFITIGFIAFVLLIPLAATSTNAMIKRLGAKRWVKLHRAVYAIGILGVTHFWLMVKRDVTEPAIYAAILALLLAYRIYKRRPAA